MMQKESISVALCTYNGARYLREQLDSIAGQARLPEELVIFDDRSTDGTPGIVEDFSSRAKFPVRWSINEKNLGSTKNFEKAISACTGNIIVLSDQDDVWMPGKLESVEKTFLASPAAGAVFSNGGTIDGDSKPLGYSLWETVGYSRKEQRTVAAGRALDVLLKHDIATGAAMAFRASLRPLVLPIPGDWVHDAWIALMAAAASGLVPVDDRLISYRVHGGQQIGGPREPLMAKVAREVEGLRSSRKKAFDKAMGDRSLELSRYSAAYDRLVERQYGCLQAMPLLGEKIGHLQARMRIMGTNRLLRIPLALKEVASGKYQRYSFGGPYSAVKDLVI